MNLAIPRKNETDFLIYIWKIIDLPKISRNDLLYIISFKLFLDPPDRAKIFINQSVKDKLLFKDDKGNLSLSQSLKKKLDIWQSKRKTAILNKSSTD